MNVQNFVKIGGHLLAVKVKDIYKRIQENNNNINIELLAGEGGMSNLIDWFHFVEGVETTGFLEGREIIIVTGIALKEKGNTLIEIMQKALEKGASAIIVNVGRHILSIDSDMIDFCNEHSFPLFTLPWEVYMSNVAKIIAQEVQNNYKRKNELVSSFKNAIFFPEKQEFYSADLARYDYQVDWKYCISIIQVHDRHSSEIVPAEELRRIKKYLENTLAYLAPQTVVFRLNDALVVCFANYLEENISHMMTQLIDNLPRYCHKEYLLYVGIGRNTLSVRCINKTYNIAKKVVRLQTKLDKPYQVLSYKDLGISQLLLAMEDTEIMSEFYANKLKYLVDYDEMNQTDYCQFLEIYFEEGCRVQEVANKMYLHRNSINYKLKKIEEILACDLSDFTIRVELMVALKVRLIL